MLNKFEIKFSLPNTKREEILRSSVTIWLKILNPAEVLSSAFVSQALGQDMAVDSVNWKILPKGQNATLCITVNQRGKVK